MKNKAAAEHSSYCGCYHCLAVFPAKEITNWTDGQTTALCPKCSVDAVLPDNAGYDFPQDLQALKTYWF